MNFLRHDLYQTFKKVNPYQRWVIRSCAILGTFSSRSLRNKKVEWANNIDSGCILWIEIIETSRNHKFSDLSSFVDEFMY